jgi:hypothetical protein
MPRPTERDQIRLLDALLEDGSATADLDPVVARTVQRLGVLHDRIVPRPAFAAELWRRLPAGVQAESSGKVGRRPVRRSSRVVGLLAVPRLTPRVGAGAPGAVATASAVVLTLLLVVVAFRAGGTPSRSAGPADSGQVVDVLASEGGRIEAERLVRLDPLTLADRTEAGPIELGGPSWGTVLSADGSTLVTIAFELAAAQSGPTEVTVIVLDTATGARRASYELPLAVGAPAERSTRLSRDGSRLVLMAEPRPAPPEWHVVETATGKILATVPSDPDGRWPSETWIDPDARRLYRLLLPSWFPDNPGPGPAIVVAHDLTTGAEVGRLEVPEVIGGTWDTGRTVPNPHPQSAGTYPVIAELRPGGALSPDGRRLALVHADADEVTLIDAERLVVERTVAFAPRSSLGDRLVSWLPLVPRDAAAKRTADGTRMSAVFAADGRHLYVWGDQTVSADDGTLTGEGLPLRLVDTSRGDVVAETAESGFNDFEPSADGRSVYVLASGPDEAGGDDEPPMVLRRLDALTLEAEAERTFAGYPKILLRPAVPNGSDGYVP